ncbi:hypothetical protein D777_00322 [Marinobacter nitratireducens]|uniref:Uncharacterized protein n=1 Tax=Marinobacter nitratireducens TaxID=1137280 RepID=A0A072MXU7_9GAMM|nr:hypothetical protein D777_00322 [Marinobacter nitratireducens]
MGNRRHISDVSDLVATRVQRANCRFTSGPRTLNLYVQVFKAVFSSRITGSFSCYLRSKRCTLTRAAEAGTTRGGPGQDVALTVRNGHDSVVEGRVNVRDAINNRLFHLFTGTCTWLCHVCLPVTCE